MMVNLIISQFEASELKTKLQTQFEKFLKVLFLMNCLIIKVCK